MLDYFSAILFFGRGNNGLRCVAVWEQVHSESDVFINQLFCLNNKYDYLPDTSEKKSSSFDLVGNGLSDISINQTRRFHSDKLNDSGVQYEAHRLILSGRELLWT